MEGALPPDLQGTLFRIGPRSPWAQRSSEPRRRTLEDGRRAGRAAAGPDGATGGRGGATEPGRPSAPSTPSSSATARRSRTAGASPTRTPRCSGTPGSVLALPETGLPSQYSRLLEPEEFAGELSVPIASHVHRVASDGGRVLFARRRPWADRCLAVGRAGGRPARRDLAAYRGMGCQRARCAGRRPSSWSGPRGSTTSRVTSGHVVFIESPTTRLDDAGRPRRARSDGCPERRAGSAWCPVTGTARRALDPARSLPGDARARRLGGRGLGRDRPVRVPLRRARGGAAVRPGGVGRRTRKGSD